jgi:hypothetical protein
MTELSSEAATMLAELPSQPMIRPSDLLAAAELVRLGLALCYEGQDGELYLQPAPPPQS